MNLSKNFTLAELTKSQIAIRSSILNNPSEQQIENLRLLCERVLQPVRDHFGKVVNVSSGFRDIILNRKLGSGDNSQHILGMAADIEIYSVANNELSDWIKENLMFDQLILEHFDINEGVNCGWVHVSYNPTISLNRKEYLMAKKKAGKTEYKPILGLSTDRYVK